MKLLFIFAFLTVLATAVLAWEKEDHEIFDLVSAIEAAEGKGTTFYSWLEVPSTASTAEIGRAYRKKSIQLHPDKNPGVKGVQERFARLGVVAAILRSKEGRRRYDFFYKNGVPKWRGTGYYYSRFRPGLGTVLVFLTILTSGMQYFVQRHTYKNDVKRIERIMRDARSLAWGSKMTPSEGQRKVKVNAAGRDDGGNTLGDKWIDIVVEGPYVYLLDEEGGLHLLDTSSVPTPSVTRTWFLALVTSLYHKFTNRDSSASESFEPTADGTEDSSSDAPSSGTATPVSKENGDNVPVPAELKGGRQATVKAGGRRRKAIKKR